jgi:hypothetical protein
MPRIGRPRLTLEDLQERVSAYCARYEAAPSPTGLPPFPAGYRETPRHREWLALYQLHSRLGRRARGQCERCSAPAVEGSVFCGKHRAGAGIPSHVAAGGVSLEERRKLLAAQRGRCPICDEKLSLSQATSDPGSGMAPPRSLLHPNCAQLVGQARSSSPRVLERLRAYLWPEG